MTEHATPHPVEDPGHRLGRAPEGDNLDELLEKAAPRRRSKLTTGLLAGLIFLIGFFLGSTAEKVFVAIQEAQAAAEAESAQPDLPETSAPTAMGTVRLIEDGVIYLERAEGGTVKVRIEATTIVGSSQSAQITDLRPGDELIVFGEKADDGTVTASRVQQSSPRP